MAAKSVGISLPPLFRGWTNQHLLLAAKDPYWQSLHSGPGAYQYTRELRLQARIVMHPIGAPAYDYTVWTSRVPHSWLQRHVVEVYFVAIQA